MAPTLTPFVAHQEGVQPAWDGPALAATFLKDTRVLVLGLGDSGLAMARWCVRCGAAVTVWDSRADTPGAGTLADEFPAVRRIEVLPLPLPLPLLPPKGESLWSSRAGEGWGEGAGAPQLILKSPGLAPTDGRIQALLEEARAQAIPVLGELDLFNRALADLRLQRDYAPRLIAITGTNGKTTVTAMTALLVGRTGKRVAVAGNIGPTMLDTLAAALDRAVDGGDALPEVWVLELSSFQLMGGGQGLNAGMPFEPDAATVLNISQDHLDWHGTMAVYTAAKAAVFGPRAVMVINRDDPLVLAVFQQLAPVLPPVKGKPKPVPRNVQHFSLQAPRQPGDFGVVVDNGMAWLVRALPADETQKRRKDEEVEIHLQRLMPVDALRIRGRHNAANALAALALATSIGCPLAPMLHGLREYAGEPHRLQWVARVGVAGGQADAYNDSKGTNVGATVAALQGLGADRAPGKLVLILGGDGKGQDFTPLAAPLLQFARAVATLGRDAEAIEAALLPVLPGLPHQRHDTLAQAVAWCFAQARNGDAVLLSPACASLDMFRNYAERGDMFVQAVQALAQESGQA